MLKKVFFLLLVFAALVYPAAAQNVSFSNLGQIGDQDILIYTFNETDGTQGLYGMWNTSSAYVPLPDDDFNIVVRPSAIARFVDPLLMMTDGLAFLETYWIQLFVLVFIIGIVWARK